MAIHPSASWHFDDLARELNERVAANLIRAVKAPDNESLVLYCYTQTCVNAAAWDAVTMMARGLVLDHAAKVVRSRPFCKFFNYGERTTELPDGTFHVYEKFDGSLGLIFHDGTRWRVTTKGAFESPQAQWAAARLRACDVGVLTEGHTYLAEIIYAANRIVVKYPFEGLVMLGAYAADGREYERGEVHAVSTALGTRIVHTHDYASVTEMKSALATFSSDREGFVVHFPTSGYRVKLKGAEYLRIHRLISHVTPLALWDVMANGGDLDTIRRDIPEEFWADFDAIRAVLAGHLSAVVASIEAEHVRWQTATNKDIGLALGTIAEPARAFIFERRKGGDRWLDHPKTRMAVCRTFRPTANALAGYTPSEAVQRVEEE